MGLWINTSPFVTKELGESSLLMRVWRDGYNCPAGENRNTLYCIENLEWSADTSYTKRGLAKWPITSLLLVKDDTSVETKG
jgi:hypothetical protein